jgi:uncharacterized membrane-anchored protein YitT (DUF2179 family)
MRVFVDVVENLTSSIRHIVGLVILGVMVLGMMFSIGASYLGTKVVDSLGERAERVSEQAIRAELEARRAEELAKDGWGYRPINEGAASDARDSARNSESAKNGWGD